MATVTGRFPGKPNIQSNAPRTKEVAAIRDALINGPPRVHNKKDRTAPPGAVYVGRPTKWGNPFLVGRHGDRAEVIQKYRTWVCDQPQLMAELTELRGKHLVCWCAPMACHADVLLELANRD